MPDPGRSECLHSWFYHGTASILHDVSVSVHGVAPQNVGQPCMLRVINAIDAGYTRHALGRSPKLGLTHGGGQSLASHMGEVGDTKWLGTYV